MTGAATLAGGSGHGKGSVAGSDDAEARSTGILEASGELIACTVCDALHVVGNGPPQHGRLRCTRCNSVLLRATRGTLDGILGSALATVILVISAVFFPFLQITAKGFSSAASLVDVAFAFSEGVTAPLALAVILMIVVLPVVRASAIGWALLPLRLGRPPLPGAKRAFRLASELKPWSMAEVFIIGVVVALVKIGGMATVSLGPAFWELTLIVLIVALESINLCEKTVWRMLETRSRS
jgi:paraquat-inducible protein A